MMIRMVGGWVFLLVPAHPGSPGQRAVKRSLLLLLLLLLTILIPFSFKSVYVKQPTFLLQRRDTYINSYRRTSVQLHSVIKHHLHRARGNHLNKFSLRLVTVTQKVDNYGLSDGRNVHNCAVSQHWCKWNHHSWRNSLHQCRLELVSQLIFDDFSPVYVDGCLQLAHQINDVRRRFLELVNDAIGSCHHCHNVLLHYLIKLWFCDLVDGFCGCSCCRNNIKRVKNNTKQLH